MFVQKAKGKGRQAFKAEDWEGAITQITQALTLAAEDAAVDGDAGADDDVAAPPKDVVCLAVRSSAYQKHGDLQHALEDANECVSIQ